MTYVSELIISYTKSLERVRSESVLREGIQGERENATCFFFISELSFVYIVHTCGRNELKYANDKLFHVFVCQNGRISEVTRIFSNVHLYGERKTFAFLFISLSRRFTSFGRLSGRLSYSEYTMHIHTSIRFQTLPSVEIFKPKI